MVSFDRYGLAVSTASDAAAEAYRDGIDRLLAAWPGAAEAFERAIAADPQFALAHVARARVHFFYAEADSAKTCVAKAREAVMASGTAREKSHVETLALGMEGQSAKSLTLALAHLDQWPRDALILSLPLGAFGLFAFSGMADHDRARVDLCEKHADQYGDDWWFLTYLGWSLTENNDVARGRALTERAFERRRANANAVHALAHAMFEDGSTAAADALIDDWLPEYSRSGILHGHIAWHQALGALEAGDPARALAIYQQFIQPKVTTAPPINSVTDAASLLWRLMVNGHAVPKDVWDVAADHAEKSFPQAGITFADVHMALVAAATGNSESLDRRIATLEKRLADGKLAAGAVVPAICRGMSAFARGDHAACARALEPVAREVVRIGGSHAQRELVEDTLLVAWMKSGEAAKARKLLDARLHRRPSARDARWHAAVIA